MRTGLVEGGVGQGAIDYQVNIIFQVWRIKGLKQEVEK